ncbi:hypothetical protein [[Eubacterium] cellulosolvens]
MRTDDDGRTPPHEGFQSLSVHKTIVWAGVVFVSGRWVTLGGR